MSSSRPFTRTLMPDALRVWLYQAVTKLSPSFTHPTKTLSSGRPVSANEPTVSTLTASPELGAAGPATSPK